MQRILITSGPTRQYIDPVRYLTNASSGQMGLALATAAVQNGHQVIVVSGPVDIEYPSDVEVVPVVTTEEMLEVAQQEFQSCDGLIGVAAPCDYRPRFVNDQKIAKTGEPLLLELVETPDIVASLGRSQRTSLGRGVCFGNGRPSLQGHHQIREEELRSHCAERALGHAFAHQYD